MKTEAGKHGDPRHHSTDIARLKAENEQLREVDPTEFMQGVALCLDDMAKSLDTLVSTVRRLSDTHRILLASLMAKPDSFRVDL